MRKKNILMCNLLSGCLGLFLLPGLSASGAELLSNPGFESSTTGWAARNCSIAAATTPVHAGSGSVRVYGRTVSWHAVRQDVLSDLQSIGSGATYQYQAWVRTASGTSSARLRLRTMSGGTTINNDVVVPVNSTGWTLVSTNKIISWSGTVTQAWLEVANDTATAEYYVDDCSVSSAGGNSAPVFTQNPFSKPNADAGSVYSGEISSGTASNDVYDPEGGALSLTKASGPGWLIVSTNGTLSGTPAATNAGLNQFTIQATDTQGGSATAQLQITVTAGNPPVFTQNPFTKPNANAGSVYSGTITSGTSGDDAYDPEGGALVFSKTSGPGWLVVSTNGALSGTPAVINAGLNQFTIRATDVLGNTATAQLQITVTIGPLPPSFTTDPITLNASAGTPCNGSISGYATDPNADPLTFTKSSGPDWLHISTSGTLSGTPDASGISTFTVTVSDGISGSDSATLFINVMGTASLPYQNSFEAYSLWSTSQEMAGWTSAVHHAAVIHPQIGRYSGASALSNVTHQQILDINDIDGKIQANFAAQAAYTTVYFDSLIQPALRTATNAPAVDSESQMAFYFYSNGKLVVRHSVYSNNFSTVIDRWTTLNNAAVTNGQWIRLKVIVNYLADTLRSDKYFTIELDGTVLSSPQAYTTYSPTDQVLDMGGSHFLCANSGQGTGSGVFSGFSVDGLARMDDLSIAILASRTARGTPLTWLNTYYPGGSANEMDEQDSDGDGMAGWQEYLAGTDPTNVNSILRLELDPQTNGLRGLRWASSTDGGLTPYQIHYSTNLLIGVWKPAATNILRDGNGVIRWVETNAPNSPSIYYRISIPAE